MTEISAIGETFLMEHEPPHSGGVPMLTVPMFSREPLRDIRQGVATLREFFTARRTQQLLRRAELEESLKRKTFLNASVNLQRSTNNGNGKKFAEHSWPAVRMKASVPQTLPGQDSWPEDQQELQELQYPGLRDTSDGPTTICNVFWKLSLTLHPFHCGGGGGGLVDFGSLWPDEADLSLLLMEAYRNTPVRSCIKDLVRMVVRCGPLRVLKALIDLNIIGLDEKLDGGNSLLHSACIARNFDAALFLCSAGVSPKVTNNHGKTAGDVCFCPRIRKVLPTRYRSNQQVAGQVSSVNGWSWGGSSNGQRRPHAPTLHDMEVIFDMATNVREVDDLLVKLQTYDFDVNEERNCFGDSVVHVAVRGGLSQLPLLLCLYHNHHADMDIQNAAGLTPLMIVARDGQCLMLDVLLCVFGVDPDVQNPDNGWAALHYACVHNHIDIISTLLKRGVDPNVEDLHGCRADDLTARSSDTECQQIIHNYRLDRSNTLTQRIIQGGLTSRDLRDTDVFVPNSAGNTLIMEAASRNQLDSLRLLLVRRKAPVNAQHCKTLQTALTLAAKAGHAQAVTMLIKYGALPQIADISGLLPLHHAVRNKQQWAVQALLQHDKCLTGLHRAHQLCDTPAISHLLREASSRRQRNIINPALFTAAMTGDANSLYCLLEDGDNVNPTSGVGDWPLYTAVINGHVDTVKLLCTNGGDITRAHPSTGNTVLHEAAARGHYEVTKYLIHRFVHYDKVKQTTEVSLSDSMLNLVNSDGKPPLILAAEKGFSKIVELLLKHGASTSIIDPVTGNLYQCQEFQGCQSLIEMHRKAHLRELLEAMDQWWGLGMARFKKAFRPRYDHTLRERHGDTLLMLACKQQRSAFVKYIIDSAVYMVHQSRRDYIKRSESGDSGTFFDMTPPQSGGYSGQHDVFLEQVPEDTTTKTPTHAPGAQGAAAGVEEVKFIIGAGDHESLHEGTETESAIQSKETRDSKEAANNRKPPARVSPPAAPQHLPPSPPRPPEEDDYDHTLRENISTLFDSMSNIVNGHLYIAENRVSHLCAINPHDGRTCYHRLIEAGDNAGILGSLLDADSTAANIQDAEGLSPLHLACSLKRRKIVQRLTSTPGIDLNVRTLEGHLPEEMTQDMSIKRCVQAMRTQQDFERLEPELLLSGASLYDTAGSTSGTSLDFDKINTRFVMMKQQMGVTDFYGEFGS